MLLIGTVVVVVIAPSVRGAEVTLTILEQVVFNSVHRKYAAVHINNNDRNKVYKHTFQILATMNHQLGVINQVN